MATIKIPQNTTAVDVALNETGSLAGLPAILDSIPVGRRVGFDDLPEAWEDAADPGQTWTPDIQGATLEIDVPVYNRTAVSKKPYTTDVHAAGVAADAGNDALAKLFQVALTYVLPGATPGVVTRYYTYGATVVLETPESLGIVLPEGHTFFGWYHGGNLVETVETTGDISVEGLSERYIMPNLLYGSQDAVGVSMLGSSTVSEDTAVTRRCIVNIANSASNVFGTFTVNEDGFTVLRYKHPFYSGSRQTFMGIIGPQYKNLTPGGTYLFSFFANDDSLAAGTHKYWIFGSPQKSIIHINIPGLAAPDVYNGAPTNIVYALPLMPPGINSRVTVRLQVPDVITSDIANQNIMLRISVELPVSAALEGRFYGFKQEDVSDDPTKAPDPWVPHIDD